MNMNIDVLRWFDILDFFYVMYYFAIHPRMPFTRTWVHPCLCVLVHVDHHFSFQNCFVLLVCVLCLVHKDVWVLPSWLSLRFSLTLICLLQLSLSSKVLRVNSKIWHLVNISNTSCVGRECICSVYCRYT